MWYYIKQSFLSFIYLIFMAMISLSILMVNILWLKIVLNFLCVGLYLVVVCAASYKDGESALKVRVANDVERREIIRTGENRPLKLKEEYKPWKGFVFGAIACAPLVILLIIHAILVAINPGLNGAGAISGLIYGMFYVFAGMFFGTFQSWHYYFSLVALIVVPLATGVPYVLGAKKIERQQEMIKKKQRQIYGDEI